MFKPYLNVNSIYFSPLKPIGNGLYEVMTHDEILAAIHPNTESRMMNELMIAAATATRFRPRDIAAKLGISASDLNVCVRVHFGCTIVKLLETYQSRLLRELVTKTDLGPAEVAKRAGFASVTSMSNHLLYIEHTSFYQLRSDCQRKVVNSNITYVVKDHNKL